MIKIFVVEDDHLVGKLIQKTLESKLDAEIQLFNSAETCMSNLHQNPDIVTIDYNLPGMDGLKLMKAIKDYNDCIQLVIVSGQEKLEVVVEAYRNGAADYLLKDDKLMVNIENAVKNLTINVALRKEVDQLKQEVIDRNKYDSIKGNSNAILKTLNLIQRVEKNNIMVLVTGESGTGKELVAKAIHYNSGRRKKPFVVVNMGAIPTDLVESELFGHEKGAFTDARERRIGKFEEAKEGTIFLDEIGEMDLGLQSKLLRVLQEKEIQRIGSNKTLKLDFRMVAATNRDLQKAVQDGKFRQDLFYRLQGFLIHLPPLRDRENDVILLAKHFLKEFCDSNKLGDITLSKEVINSLLAYNWPGNVRELKAVIERAALLAENNIIKPEDITFMAA